MFWEKINMIGNDHQVANLELRIHASCSIGNEKRLDAQFVHHTNRECNLLHGVSLIEVEASLHGHDIHSSQLSKNQFSTMTFDSGYRKVGNILILELVRVSYF